MLSYSKILIGMYQFSSYRSSLTYAFGHLNENPNWRISKSAWEQAVGSREKEAYASLVLVLKQLDSLSSVVNKNQDS